MATFILVHGAWHGGWCWERVAPLLRAAGHSVHAPTLTGLAERAGLLTPDVGLATHVEDVVGVLAELGDEAAIVVGHSYGGMVITGVAERVPGRVARLIYLDALVPIEGERSLRRLYLRHAPERWHRLAAQRRPDAPWRIAPPTGTPLMGVTDEADLRWLRARLTDHPARSCTDALPGDHAAARHLPHSFIRCPAVAGAPNGFTPDGERVRRAGGAYHELAVGHDAMVTRPQDLAALLLRIADAG